MPKLIKHSLRIKGHLTSVTLEPIYWDELKRLAESKRISIAELVARIDADRDGNLCSEIRTTIMAARISECAMLERAMQALAHEAVAQPHTQPKRKVG